MMPPFMPPELTPEQEKAIIEFQKRQSDIEISWRRVQTGPWGTLFCSCRLEEDGRHQSLLQYRPADPVSAGCRVHGGFIVSYTGEII